MKIIESLYDYNEWLAFFEYKKLGGHLSKTEENELSEFIESREYQTVADRLNNGGFFSVPECIKVNKSSSNKKRKVFTFPKDEKFIQKFIAYKLLDYDYLFSDNLFSFRRDMGVKKAVCGLVFKKNISKMYSYKLDISDYFNSVKPEILLPMLKKSLLDDDKLYNVIEDMLNNPYAFFDGEKVEMQKGILAGSSISGFLANLYLCELDTYFEINNVPYARYSDDIIFFSEKENELNKLIDYVNAYLYKMGLSVNESKVCRSEPDSEWTFLGFSYNNGIIDISDISKQKLKKKMRRKMRALLRWRKKKSAPPERAVAAFIRYFNKKLYDNPVNNEITWCRWYFPIINTDKSLKEIDAYMQQCIRFLATESHTKAQYNFTYEKMKSLGYKTLVNSFYKYATEQYQTF